MAKTWILIANAERARCFERHAADHSLTELMDFVHPHSSLNGQAGGGDLTGAAGKGHGRTGHAGTQARSLSPIPTRMPKSAQALRGNSPITSTKRLPDSGAMRSC